MLNSLKLLSDVTRLRLLSALEKSSLTVAELQEVLGMGQSRISTQLAALKKEGLVKDVRSGKNVLYALSAPPSLMVVAQAAAKEIDEVEKDKVGIRLVLQKRENETKAYFDTLAGKFGRQYVPGRSWKALAEALLRVLSFDTVVDLGAGEATISQMLSQRARHVIAVDNSPKMVEFGRELALKNGMAHLEYRLGDLEEPPVEKESADLVIMSQSLHHAHSPERALQAAYGLLREGGCLIVLDLLLHTFEKAREVYADRWMGFREVDLLSYLESAGFVEVFTDIADKEAQAPFFQTLVAVAWRREKKAE